MALSALRHAGRSVVRDVIAQALVVASLVVTFFAIVPLLALRVVNPASVPSTLSEIRAMVRANEWLLLLFGGEIILVYAIKTGLAIHCARLRHAAASRDDQATAIVEIAAKPASLPTSMNPAYGPAIYFQAAFFWLMCLVIVYFVLFSYDGVLAMRAQGRVAYDTILGLEFLALLPGSCLYLTVWARLDRRQRVIIDDRGVTKYGLTRVSFIPWHDIVVFTLEGLGEERQRYKVASATVSLTFDGVRPMLRDRPNDITKPQFQALLAAIAAHSGVPLRARRKHTRRNSVS